MTAENDRITNPGDPTLRTLASQELALNSLKEILDGKIIGLEKQLNQFRQDITTVPTEVDRRIQGLDALMQERFQTVQTQFDGIEKGIEKALNAQKEMATQLNTSNAAAISKAEESMKNQIAALEALLKVEVSSLRTGVFDNSGRISQIIDRKFGEGAHREMSQGNQIQFASIVGLIAALVFGGIGVFLGVTAGGGQERIVERIVEKAPAERSPTIVMPGAP